MPVANAIAGVRCVCVARREYQKAPAMVLVCKLAEDLSIRFNERIIPKLRYPVHLNQSSHLLLPSLLSSQIAPRTRRKHQTVTLRITNLNQGFYWFLT